MNVFDITDAEAKQLYKFLSYQYVSHEDYPLVYDVIHRLVKREIEDERQDSEARSKASETP